MQAKNAELIEPFLPSLPFISAIANLLASDFHAIFRMSTFRYKISLRIIHPNIDPVVISQTLHLQPKRIWKLGEPRITPAGTPLQGNYDNSYWSYAYSTPDDEQSSAFIRSTALALQQHREFFHRLRTEGADIEFFIGWFSDRNFGETFSCDLLGILADLQIDLGFDVYPEDNEVTPAL
jgi:hypothetical protein